MTGLFSSRYILLRGVLIALGLPVILLAASIGYEVAVALPALAQGAEQTTANFICYLPPDDEKSDDAWDRAKSGNDAILNAGLTLQVVTHGATHPLVGPPEDGTTLPQWYRVDGKQFEGRNYGGLRWLEGALAAEYGRGSRDIDRDFDTLAAAGNDSPRGIWSDGSTMWVADHDDAKLYAYDLKTRQRDNAKDFNNLKNAPTGIWSDGTTMWVADHTMGHLYAYDLETRQRSSSPDFHGFTLVRAGNGPPTGLWSDGTTMWVAGGGQKKLYAYYMETRQHDSRKNIALETNTVGAWSHAGVLWALGSGGKAFAYDPETRERQSSDLDFDFSGFGNTRPGGAWSDGKTVWVSDEEDGKIYAYRATSSGLDVRPDKDFKALAAAGNNDPYGIWSDGTTMWVVDRDGKKIYAYSMATRQRDSAKDFNYFTQYGNDTPQGIWSDGTTMWVSDLVDGKLYAYNLKTTLRDNSKDFNGLAHAGISNPTAMWSDGITMWVNDESTHPKLYAYSMATKQRDSSKDVALGKRTVGIWSHDGVAWTLRDDGKALAYDLESLGRQSSHDLKFRSFDDMRVRGAWSNGETIWVSDELGDKIHSYHATGDTNEFSRDEDTSYLYEMVKPAEHLTDVRWWYDDNGDRKNLKEWEMEFTIHDDVVSESFHKKNGLYMMLAAGRMGSTTYYMGLQPNLAKSGTVNGVGKGFLFSGWGTLDYDAIRPAKDGWKVSSRLEGDFVSVRKRYAWKTGRTYRLKIAPDGDPVGEHQWMGAWITDVQTGVTTWMGSLRFLDPGYVPPEELERSNLPPPAPSKMIGTPVVTVVEVYGWDIHAVGIPKLRLSMKPPESGDGERPKWIGISYTTKGNNNARNNDVTYDAESDLVRVQVGGMTRRETPPGRTTLPSLPTVETPELEGFTVSAVAGETTRLAVSWNTVTDADKYLVQWKTGDAGYNSGEEATGASHTFTGLSADTTYTVQVTAIDTDADPDAELAAGEATGTTLAAMGTVTVAAVADSSDSLDVSWPSVNGAVGYVMEYKTGDGSYSAVTRSDATATTERITGLGAETAYAVKVTARHTIAGSKVDGDSAEGSGTTNAPPPANSPASGAPTISGTAQVGETLTANTSGISDADGLTNATFSYQWLADGSDISGATSSAYTTVSGDVGKAIKVKVSFTDDAGNAETLTSEATDAVVKATNTPASGAPTISGTAQAGETLTADTSGISDADGLTNASFSYQWLADGSDISGATGSSYAPVAADVDKALSVRVSFTDDAGNAESLTSEATDAVKAEDPPEEEAAAVTFVIYHDPNAGDAAVDRYNQGVKLLKDANISYSEVKGDVQEDVDQLAGVTGSVIPRFFLGDPTEEGWVSETKVNNGGLRWLKGKVAELTSG